MKELLAISPGNVALEFLAKRIADDNYRGEKSSQHNRYTKSDVVTILTIFNNYAPNGSLMKIRTTDISKRPANSPDEKIFAQFCTDVVSKIHKGTQDAMRKNYFVDFHRMGFIARYDKKKNSIVPFASGKIKYVSLTKQGQRLINATDLEEQHFVFSKGIDSMLGGYINLLLEIFRTPDYGIETITIYEYMFFVSAVHSNTAFEIDTQRCVEYIKLYRTLSRGQREAVVNILKEKMQPKNYLGNKIEKRDFYNWWNKAEQLFSVITQTVYFEERENKLIPRELRNAKGERTTLVKLSRSISEKFEYFTNHKVSKFIGFELHHVVPLSWAESREQFILLDVWINMVYIDAFSHAKITQNNNNNVQMEHEGTTVILNDLIGNNVELVLNNNIMYSPDKLNDMLDYNTKLLHKYL
ncbi:MAG: hypothetical protein LBG05_00255 [Treponema sp.]|jgi:hypothetical protein|nr:hypothetical protein [Treponema sp.]